MNSETVSQGKAGAAGMPVSINTPPSDQDRKDRCQNRFDRLTAKLQRQKDRGAPENRIEETKAAIVFWAKELRISKIRLGEED